MAGMRSFRIFKYSPPERTAADYSESEKEHFRVAFKAIALRYRIFGYSFLALGLAGFLLLVLSKQNYRWWLFFSIMVFAVIYSLLFGPLCPACKRKVEDGVRTFCPECGGKLRSGGFLKAPQCLSCGKDLWRGKRRSYEIRCCTHCGVFLDGKGI
jgi:predicted RNA-binding Zn-ribbon protein involved in translation (DUF1610 family)